MKPIKMRIAGKIVKDKKKKPISEKNRLKNALRWKQELRGL
jgi:hypothetical protein|tara:strand:- start:79 stop:201 length:123 start_codon:yes stop_codon:yes gene_type:complete